MSESQLIDNFKQIEPKKESQPVKIVAGILFLLVMVLTAFCYKDVLWYLELYAEQRGKILLGADSLHGMVSAFFTASIPVTAYNCWYKKRNTMSSYLVFLVFAAVLFLSFLVLGLELLFVISPGLGNSLMPDIMVIPPFSFFFDLVFISAALLGFLVLKLLFRKKLSHINSK